MAAPHRDQVLVLDDSPDIRMLYRVFLADRFEITCTGCPEEALALVASQRYDLVVTNLNLNHPRITGRHVLWTLRSHPAYRDVPVMVVSSYVQPYGSLLQSLENEFDACLSKPFSRADIRGTVERLLAPPPGRHRTPVVH